ncbi:MAG TPA: pyrimidine/purine nucleoside phosphorylase [Methylibium sp.]
MTEKIHAAAVTTKANVYFDGRCVSHSIELAEGKKASVGVILPSELVFTTGAAEVMEGVAGACEVRLKGESGWTRYAAGQSFSVPAQSSFEIRVVGEPYHYICRFS